MSKAKIWRILKEIGWAAEAPDFDPPSDFFDFEICQLILGAPDGFSIIDELDKREAMIIATARSR